jgi:hypothetical protein
LTSFSFGILMVTAASLVVIGFRMIFCGVKPQFHVRVAGLPGLITGACAAHVAVTATAARVSDAPFAVRSQASTGRLATSARRMPRCTLGTLSVRGRALSFVQRWGAASEQTLTATQATHSPRSQFASRGAPSLLARRCVL